VLRDENGVGVSDELMNLAPGAVTNGRQHVSHAVASGGRRRDEYNMTRHDVL